MKVKALTFKNDNGDTITIEVDIYSEHDKIPLFTIRDILIKKFRKRTEMSLLFETKDSYVVRDLPFDSTRSEYMYNEYLKYVTKEQLQQALLNAWEMYKPDIDNVQKLIRWHY